jgi:hypothetical protein
MSMFDETLPDRSKSKLNRRPSKFDINEDLKNAYGRAADG